MFWIAMIFLMATLIGVSYLYVPKNSEGQRLVSLLITNSVRGVLALIAVLCIITTSYVNPPKGQIGLITAIYACKPIADGRIVALAGECGKRADVLRSGFQLVPFINVFNDIEYVDELVVMDGSYVNLAAKDGAQQEAGQVASKPWPLSEATYKKADGTEVTGNMLDAEFFLTSGLGRKGPQATILTPGNWVVNPYLWDVTTSGNNTRVEIDLGEVGVIKSAIDEDVVPAFAPRAGAPAFCGKNAEDVQDLGQIKATLVSVGCRGVWREPISAGTYFVNRDLYRVTIVDTRVQNWTYAGGYTRRFIDLRVDDDGTIQQELGSELIEVPDDAAGEAVNMTVDGWQVWQEVRLQARVTPEFAPLLVAAVGELSEVEDRIISPQVRSVLRNIGGSRITVKNTVAYEQAMAELDSLKARLDLLKSSNNDPSLTDGMTPEQRATELSVLERQIAGYLLPDPNKEVTRPTRPIDFQSERETLETMVAEQIQKLGTETGIDIVQVAFGKTDLPPELLVARKVEQLAASQRPALIQQRTAQVQRQATEAAKARADKQSELVQASINVEVSRQKIESRRNEGEAEKAFSILQAEGRKAEVEVLGQDRVFMANLFRDALEALKSNPQILTDLKLPTTVVMGGGSGLEGMAAVLKSVVPAVPTAN